MPLTSFLILTGLGSFLWVTILTLIGFYVGKNIDRIKEMAHTAVIWSVIGVVLLLVIYFLWHKYKRCPIASTPTPPQPQSTDQTSDAPK
jgi:membrane protein DedA with SNARE-associated domain